MATATAGAIRRDPQVQRIRMLAKVMDDYFLDPILGFIVPGLGDLIGSALGLYVVALAVRRKLAPIVLARMIMNLAIDAAIGVIPLLGDAADFAWKANDKNVALLEDRSITGKATAKDWLAVGGAIAAFLAVIALVIYALVRIAHAIFGGI